MSAAGGSLKGHGGREGSFATRYASAAAFGFGPRIGDGEFPVAIASV